MAKKTHEKKSGISEIADAIDMTDRDTKEIFADFIKMLENSEIGEKISIPKLGIFQKVVKKPRKARNPHTGETFMTKKKVTLKFRLANNLRDL